MEEENKKATKVRIVKKYSESFKRHVVSEIESGLLNQSEASREYGIPIQTVNDWVKKYGMIRKQYIEVVMKDQKDKIAELESELARVHLKLKYYDCLLAAMGEDYGFSVKKNLDSEELEIVDKSTGKVLKRFAK